MSRASMHQTPARATYDVVIVGGAMLGSSTAWFLTENPDFDGSVLVIERDPSYGMCSTAHTNSCIRQQFSSALNVRISQFAADFIKNFRAYMGGDTRVPELSIQSYGYLYLADSPAFAEVLRQNQKVQLAEGVATQLLTPDEIARDYPFYRLDDIVLGSINRIDEGYWDGGTVFDWLRRSARERGVEYISNEVVEMSRNAAGDRVETVTLKSGEKIACGQVVNASGPRATRTAAMAGIEIPVEPRKRFTWIFSAERPLDRELPLTIDPSGVHMRQDGPTTYMAGGHADPDPAVDFDDFTMDHGLWQDQVWPTIATRIPQFEAIRVVTEWVGHYAYNTLDQNAIVGPHSQIENFVFLNGFSGHGLQQAPAMGRGTAEYLTYGEFRSLDLSPLGYGRIERGEPVVEKAVI
ncbi:NAD(P)/FAD-dependent oxidoreductase [Sedimentitalea nanhaiensis]|uniref:Glycine/D-amino acid oxidase n=1 Tax=Sedimentitalea nanhaiensis TaxID=999627 RepID=A0A1I7DAB8_9RHOB|nr:FAD-binding oxidoreductase [Sedimentitalea nanhaiensis]SFU08565.1 Glycine/D-amino acid oxidase [Sedimentitalea nanhaiensis]